MSYTINRTFTDASFEEIDQRTREALKSGGFGVLTEINVAATLKKKIGVEIAPYVILGACNPQMAHRALEMEPRIGAMLPCNVILREVDEAIEVSAIDPLASMMAIDNDELKSVARRVRDLLADVVESI